MSPHTHTKKKECPTLPHLFCLYPKVAPGLCPVPQASSGCLFLPCCLEGSFASPLRSRCDLVHVCLTGGQRVSGLLQIQRMALESAVLLPCPLVLQDDAPEEGTGWFLRLPANSQTPSCCCQGWLPTLHSAQVPSNQKKIEKQFSECYTISFQVWSKVPEGSQNPLPEYLTSKLYS